MEPTTFQIIVPLLSALVVVLFIAVSILSVSSLKLWVEFKGLQNSTHKISYINPLADFEKMSDDTKKKIQDFDFGNIS